MVQPLAIILNDRVVVGAQLEQKLEGLDYRVMITDNPDGLAALCVEHKPLVVLLDLAEPRFLEVVVSLRAVEETRHVPVIGYATEATDEFQAKATGAGVSLVATDSAVLQHLKQLLDQALRVD